MDINEKNRLDRIEEKIDKLSDAIISLARAEEKISNLSETTHVILKRMVDYDSRIRLVESLAQNSESKLKTISMVFWTSFIGIVCSIFGAIKWINIEN
jgi:hypothetical protein